MNDPQLIIAVAERREIIFHDKILEILGHRGLAELTQYEIKASRMYADLKVSKEFGIHYTSDRPNEP